MSAVESNIFLCLVPNMNLTNHFLIAMPGLVDLSFAKSVVYLCSHDANGALGFVINRPGTLTLGLMFEQVKVDCVDLVRHTSVSLGGPVFSEHSFVLHQPAGKWETVFLMEESIGVGASKEILIDIAKGSGPERFLVVLGYAGWGAGQLENEMAQNAWLSGPAKADVIFNTPNAERRKEAGRLLGIDIERLSGQTGHA